MRASLAIGLHGGFVFSACSWKFHDRLRTVVARVLRRGRDIVHLVFSSSFLTNLPPFLRARMNTTEHVNVQPITLLY
jgi:hypothetical protein